MRGAVGPHDDWDLLMMQIARREPRDEPSSGMRHQMERIRLQSAEDRFYKFLGVGLDRYECIVLEAECRDLQRIDWASPTSFSTS